MNTRVPAMEQPSYVACLVCSARCSRPAQRVAELQARLALRLRAEMDGQPPAQQEALCPACSRLLGELDDLQAQVDRLRRQLRRRQAAGAKRKRLTAATDAGQKGGEAGSKVTRVVRVKPDVGEEAGPVAAAVCEAQLAEPALQQTGELVPGRAADAARQGHTGGPLTDAAGRHGGGDAPPASPPDGRCLLGLPTSPHRATDSPDEYSVTGGASSETDSVSVIKLEDSTELIGPDLSTEAKLIGTRVPAKPRRRQRRPATQRRNAAQRPNAAPVTKALVQVTKTAQVPEAAPVPNAASVPETAPVPWLRVEGPSPFQCVVCSRQFQYLASIKIHARTHTGEKPHVCDVCGRRFALRTTLVNHRRLHSGDKPFKCDDCGRAFAQQSYLCVHRRVHSNDKPFCCELCGKTFKQAYYLNIHKRIHSGEKPYTCDDCGKGFATVSNMYKHQRGHTGERQFCCEHCGKTFRDSCQLRDHRRTHTGERPFACEVCGMKFTLAKVLARHSRMHTGEKPYVCSDCGKAFSRSENLRDHARMHDGVSVPSPASAAAAAALADDPGAGDDRYYMVDVMPVTDVEEALAWPLEVYRTETGVTVYKTLGEDGAALYQTETGEVFRELSGEGEQLPPPSPPPPAPAVDAVHDDQLFDDPSPVPVVLPGYDRLGI